jgi:hypothetical protein
MEPENRQDLIDTPEKRLNYYPALEHREQTDQMVYPQAGRAAVLLTAALPAFLPAILRGNQVSSV